MRRVCSAREQMYVAEGTTDADWGAGDTAAEEEAAAEEAATEEDSGPEGPRERFFRLWTLKESFVKATGQGLAFPLKDITFSWEEADIKGSVPGWHFYQSEHRLNIHYGPDSSSGSGYDPGAGPGGYESYIISVCEADEEEEKQYDVQ